MAPLMGPTWPIFTTVWACADTANKAAEARREYLINMGVPFKGLDRTGYEQNITHGWLCVRQGQPITWAVAHPQSRGLSIFGRRIVNFDRVCQTWL